MTPGCQKGININQITSILNLFLLGMDLGSMIVTKENVSIIVVDQ